MRLVWEAMRSGCSGLLMMEMMQIRNQQAYKSAAERLCAPALSLVIHARLAGACGVVMVKLHIAPLPHIYVALPVCSLIGPPAA